MLIFLVLMVVALLLLGSLTTGINSLTGLVNGLASGIERRKRARIQSPAMYVLRIAIGALLLFVLIVVGFAHARAEAFTDDERVLTAAADLLLISNLPPIILPDAATQFDQPDGKPERLLIGKRFLVDQIPDHDCEFRLLSLSADGTPWVMGFIDFRHLSSIYRQNFDGLEFIGDRAVHGFVLAGMRHTTNSIRIGDPGLMLRALEAVQFIQTHGCPPTSPY